MKKPQLEPFKREIEEALLPILEKYGCRFYFFNFLLGYLSIEISLPEDKSPKIRR